MRVGLSHTPHSPKTWPSEYGRSTGDSTWIRPVGSCVCSSVTLPSFVKPIPGGSVTFFPFTYRSRCWWMWNASASCASAVRCTPARRSARNALPLSHGGGPESRFGRAAKLTLSVYPPLEPFELLPAVVRTTPRTIATIGSAAIRPPSIPLRRSTVGNERLRGSSRRFGACTARGGVGVRGFFATDERWYRRRPPAPPEKCPQRADFSRAAAVDPAARRRVHSPCQNRRAFGLVGSGV